MELIFGLGYVGVIALFIVAILWVLLPFAVFGMKDIARELVAAQNSANELQRQNNIKLDQIIAQNANRVDYGFSCLIPSHLLKRTRPH